MGVHELNWYGLCDTFDIRYKNHKRLLHMHKTSFMKAQAFFDTYIDQFNGKPNKKIRILDIGSKIYGEHKSYADILKNANVEYVGLDLEKGRNVDIVPDNVYLWNEIEDESFDFCISGQTFEHNPFFWITFAEIARVLKQDGKVLIIAPGRGIVHRYPVDCWRFYPDSWQSLCVYTGLTLDESLFEEYQFNRVEEGAEWCDSCVVAHKPRFSSSNESEIFYGQLAKIASTLPSNFNEASSPIEKPLVSLSSYKKQVERPLLFSLSKRLRLKGFVKRIVRYY